MRLFLAFFLTIVFSLFVSAQSVMEPLATANGRSFTAQDLSPNIGEAWVKLPTTLRNAKKALLEKQIDDVLLNLEADKAKMSVAKLVEKEVYKKIADPSETEIKKIYNANKSQIGDVPLSKIRQQIIDFVRRPKEASGYKAYVKSLRSKYNITYGKSTNSNSLVASDILATIGGRNLLYAEYFRENGLAIYEIEANVFDAMKNALEQVVDSATYASEAQSLGIPTGDYIAKEITNKLKTYSDEETEKVQIALRKKLYPKYRVRYFVSEPKPFIQNVSADNDPSLGRANAPVTVVMFTDFQCPACAATYPILKQIVGEFGNSARLVVRDFPLSIHENAFQSAIAANAAHSQGKFFQFKEILYKNQNSLDTESLKKYAVEIGLNLKRFESDMKKSKFKAEVRKDISDGKRYGVGGTPSIFVNGYKIRVLSPRAFRKAIKRALSNATIVRTPRSK